MGKPGKINEEFFKSVILPGSGFANPLVKQGPRFGVDVSVVEIGHGLAIAMTSDPLSLISSLGLEESAWLSVHLMANDMATTSFAPQYMQAVLNLPTSLSDEDFKSYWGHIDRFCKDIGVAITGGHTGSIEGQNSTISGGGTMVTIAPASEVLTTPRANEGDAFYMTASAAMSSAAILALSFPETVKNKAGKDCLDANAELFYQTSVLPVAKTVRMLNTKEKTVNAMHDVTEGGIMGAAFEMATAAGLGLELWPEAIHILPETAELCEVFDLPFARCIGAGSMLLSVEPSKEAELEDEFQKAGIAVTKIGRFTSEAEGKTELTPEGKTELTYQETDPYWAAFFTALNKGWK
ncbi:AIR synthase-related protein [Jiulongibacter sp. NS-SX5]|uniref:AIR synthase-related protein n=1 Tax=Jiulongibacter sp. NS-SX5 TaxID=3463854 RepID=UPI004058EE64